MKRRAQECRGAQMGAWQRVRQELSWRRLQGMQEKCSQRALLLARLERRGAGRGALPAVPAPLCLAPGEQAYYCAEAAHCSAPYGEMPPAPPQMRDQGLLVLTDRRLVFLGRRCQIFLGYDHLQRVSRLRGALAFLMDQRQRCELFALRRPLECLLCLETVLQHCQSGPPHAAVQDLQEPDGYLSAALSAAPRITRVLDAWNDDV